MAPRLVVCGWDSATWEVVDPLAAQGRLPVIAGLQERGWRAALRSTWPPMTDSAWTSAFTGRNPGGHGIFGAWYRAPGAYACRYFSSRDRRVPTVWELAPTVRWAVLGVPMTFPPTPLNGVLAATYGAPPGARFCEPPELQEELARRFRIDDLMDRAPASSLERFLDDLVRGAQVQSDALVWLAEEAEADCAVVVWPQVDRAQHFFWRFRGEEHPLAGAVARAYEALDAATGRVVDTWPEADVMVVSDHGAGPLAGDVNIGAWLAGRGHAAYRRAHLPSPVRLAWTLPAPARRLGKRLAPGLASRAMGATLSGQLGPFEWARTDAFVGFHGDLWINLQGREPQGHVAPDQADALLAALGDDLTALEDRRTGRGVVAAVHRRGDVYSGAATGLAPDAIIDCWSAGYRVALGRGPSKETVVPPTPLAGVGEAWSADHRPLGVFLAAGPRVVGGGAAELSLLDVCPTKLALLEQPLPAGLDGSVARAAIDARWLGAHPPTITADAHARQPGGEYSEEEAAAVAAHLKDLGYIE